MAWSMRRLGDLLSLEYGKPLPEDDRDPHGSVPAFGANGVLCRTNKSYENGPSIIVGRKGSAGEVTLVEEPFWPTDVTYFLRHDEAVTDLRYLYYLLLFLDLPSLAKGVKPGINRNDVYALSAPCPTLREQKRIVAILDEAFEGIRIATANAEKNLANARELRESSIHSALNQGWPTAPITQFLTNGRAISYGVVKPGRHDPNGVRLIKSQQVRDGWMDLSEDFRITAELDAVYRRTKLVGGEVLLNLVGASIGRSAIAPAEIRGANVSRAIAVIPVQPDWASWVQCCLHSFVGQKLIGGRTGGAAQPVLNLAEVKTLPIPRPAARDRDATLLKLERATLDGRRLEKIYSDRDDQFQLLKQSILARAFSGQLTAAKGLAA